MHMCQWKFTRNETFERIVDRRLARLHFELKCLCFHIRFFSPMAVVLMRREKNATV